MSHQGWTPGQQFDEETMVPPNGRRRFFALARYFVLFNGLAIMSIFEGVGPPDFFWPKRWW